MMEHPAEADRAARVLATGTAMVAAHARGDLERVLDLTREADDERYLREVALVLASTAAAYVRNWAKARTTPLEVALDQLAALTADSIRDMTTPEEP
ncbi:hypothetical protein K6U06_19775 [Acidiferrimicrobium sp. IK]|uniref:hypothetical protein n=1 Tax=Acidiferrimicrobium sp. IK TaxID=2871700 RepID=UPI0021CB0411|nr:hypothetical protein [Acidiferrimicrobium sp. IK]MCU4186614.1 hypothetical protein [Acidiferrimicrobium sp. IK]